MPTARRASVSLAVALFLLGFTAFDLGSDVFAYPSCETDLYTGPWSQPSAANSESDQGKSGSSPDVHVDDCFCCSHCVRHTTFFFLTQAAKIQRFGGIAHADAFFLTAREFFRPPRLI